MTRIKIALSGLVAIAVLVGSLLVFAPHRQTQSASSQIPKPSASAIPSSSTSTHTKQSKNFYISKQIHHYVSKPLREIKGVLTRVKKDDYRAEKLESKREDSTPNPKTKALKLVDPVVQTSSPLVTRPTPPGGGGGGGGSGSMPSATGFNGLSDGLNGFTVNSAPPDTNMDVGSTQIVEVVNSALIVLSKTGTVLYGPVDLNTLWSGFGGDCAAQNDGDPTVAYDRLANRWVISQFAVSQNNSGYVRPYLQCVAVSRSSDATGAYNEYSFGYTTFFPDYPKLSVWPDSYYTTFNGFTTDLQNWAGGYICAYDRAKMIANQPATQQCAPGDPNYGGILVATIDGTSSPAPGTPAYAISMDSQTTMATWRVTTVWGNTPSITVSANSLLTIPAYNYACPLVSDFTCIPQPGTTNTLDTLGDRMMYRFVYRKVGSQETFVASQTVDVNNVTSVRWYELRPSGSNLSLYQSSTFNPSSSHRWMPSIAMDRVGNIATLYSTSSNTVKPSVAIAGRLVTDALGTLGQGEAIVKQGGGVQNGTLTRWGDYSALVVDPADDCTFWGATEYLASTGTFNWSTWITKFKFANCVPPPAAPVITSITTSGSVGSTLTITGTGLTGTNLVKVGGVGASSVTVKSDTQVTATVSPGTTSGNVWISCPGGTITSSGSFTVTIPNTTVSSVSPSSTTSVNTGTSITLAGTNLNLVSAVSVGGQSVSNFTATASNLYFALPSTVSAGAKSIVLTTPNGNVTPTSTLKVVTGTSTLPTISRLSATRGSAGSAITVTGKNLAGASAVKFGATSANFVLVSPTTLVVAVPAMASGTVSLTITTAGVTSAGSSFTVQTGSVSPTISSVSPTSATVGNLVTVTGSGLLTTSAVSFNSVAVTSFTVISDTQISFVVPAGSSSGAFTVTTQGGTATYSGTITIY